MKSSFILLLAGCFLGRVAAKAIQTDTNKLVDDNGKIVLHQIFNPGTAKAEISSLRKEVEMLHDETQVGLYWKYPISELIKLPITR